jgi:hypothetical protein
MNRVARRAFAALFLVLASVYPAWADMAGAKRLYEANDFVGA